MFIIYDLIFLLSAVFFIPFYLFKRKFHPGFSRRLGVLPKDLNLGRPIWIHAVSVGEAASLRKLLAELRLSYPDKKYVLSTVTPTGNKIFKGLAGQDDLVTYLPLDIGFIVKKVIDKVNPALFIIAETEIWPNLISYLAKKNIPILTANGRISDSSFGGYRLIKFLSKPILNKINLFCLQSERDAQRLSALGVAQDKIKVTGNMKFDAVILASEQGKGIKNKLGLAVQDRLLVAASTHPGEEEMILGAYQGLIKKNPHLKLLIAPRHPERASAVSELVEKLGFTAVRISLFNLKPETRDPRTENRDPRTVFILDTIGELINYYAIADIVFVGGSLVQTGGHNILEPAALDKPVIFGPYMFNFRDIADLFLINKAAILVRDTQELREGIESLLGNHSLADSLVRNARKIITENRGATRKNLEQILILYRN